MKTKFSTLDIIAILPELKAKLCTGWRVNQVYDCDYKTYLFKLNKSIVQMKKDDDPVSVDEVTANKMSFIIESGLRMHTTDYDWPKSHAPSHFATKLRKAIRNKRIENISQIGIDRAVDMQFGSGAATIHLIVELYDRGNMILTDEKYTILAILRWRKPTEKQLQQQQKLDDQQQSGNSLDQNDSENFRMGDIYPLHLARKREDLTEMTEDKIAEMLTNARTLLGGSQNYRKRNKQKQDTDDGQMEINLRDLFNPFVIYGSSLLEDRLIEHVFENQKVKKCVLKIPANDAGQPDPERVRHYAKLIKLALEDADTVLAGFMERQRSPGYIVQKKQDTDMSDKIGQQQQQQKQKLTANGRSDTSKEKSAAAAYVSFVDFFPMQTCAQRRVEQEPALNLAVEEFESFDRAVDVYYSNMESQKIDSQAMNAEREAMKKLGNLKISQEKRLEDLARIQREDEERGRMIELNCDKVENALLIIRSMLANQMSWSDIWDTIREAQSMNDPIASLITQVNFARNEFTMRLCDPYDEAQEGDDQDGAANQQEDDQENSNHHHHQQAGKKKDKKKAKKNKGGEDGGGASKHKSVDIDIGLSAYANARRFFTRRRTAVNKEKKTIEVSKKAFKNVERQTKERLKEVVVKTNITKARKRYWFENFFWFISSDGYLVVAGRDSEQNESLVKRYMKNNDIYVHADLHGASSVIIKNESSEPIPPKTLVEAGAMAVCYSSAWDSKIATTSWWVYPKQVSKTAPAGEYLTQGAFVIRGKKNFLPLSNLVLGFGFLFRLDEESIERRQKERLAKRRFLEEHGLKGDDETQATEASPDVSDQESLDGGESSGGDDDDDAAAGKPEPVPQEAQALTDNAQLDTVEEAEGEGKEDQGEDNEEEEDDDDEIKSAEYRLMDTLTEAPTPDDVLLYSIPMCGPYSALQNYKYKVKVVPGSNKRGKAAKSCLALFMHDKKASQRERDLLRALKDQDYARNIPNKVKVSASNMKSITKKRPKKSEVRLPQR